MDSPLAYTVGLELELGLGEKMFGRTVQVSCLLQFFIGTVRPASSRRVKFCNYVNAARLARRACSYTLTMEMSAIEVCR